ncbi:LacI family transcriptional regulator [Methylococcus sp. ANG]|uniref:LacI family transcriptional regulator n=1 Tax=Methylococcus sp. ANG TaxID=3231903 RepID=UPI00345774E8
MEVAHLNQKQLAARWSISEASRGGARSEILIDKTGQAEVITASDGSLTVTVPIRIKRRGSRKAVMLPDGGAVQPRPWDDTPTPIQFALARGHRWLAMVDKIAGSDFGQPKAGPGRGEPQGWGEQSGEARTLSEVAEREGMDRAYVSRMVNLTTLAPDIVAAILDETLPLEVTLFDLASGTPLLWEEQRKRAMPVSA